VVTNSNDPKSLVIFALDLHQKKKYREAAHFFLVASEKGPADFNRNRFRLACLKATATCLLLAGDQDSFHNLIDKMRGEMTGFQQANMSDDVCLLIAISDRLKGNPANLNSTIAYNVKELFK